MAIWNHNKDDLKFVMLTITTILSDVINIRGVCFMLEKEVYSRITKIQWLY